MFLQHWGDYSLTLERHWSKQPLNVKSFMHGGSTKAVGLWIGFESNTGQFSCLQSHLRLSIILVYL